MIHATQLNSHASSLRGVDISMSSSEGTLQELDKLYPSDSPNQLAEEAIFNPTKYSLLNLQNLKQWARHVNQGTSSWCALTRNFGRGASKAQPKCQAFFIQREREPIFSHPTEKKTPIYFKTNIVPCFYPCLFMDLILDSIWCIAWQKGSSMQAWPTPSTWWFPRPGSLGNLLAVESSVEILDHWK